MKNYVINLDRSIDRLQTFRARAAERGLVFQRVAAVDGTAIPDDEFSTWQAKCRMSNPMTRAEVACFLSHRRAWDLIVATSDPWAFIAEDDIVFAPGAEHFLTSSAWLPTAFDIVKAETMDTPVKMSGKVYARHCGSAVRVLISRHNGSAGYFVSQDGARRLIELTETHCEPADIILFHPELASAASLLIGQIDPALCMQDFHFFPDTVIREAVNTIGSVPRLANRTQREVKRSLPARVERKIRHLRDRLWRAGLAMFRISEFRRVLIRS